MGSSNVETGCYVLNSESKNLEGFRPTGRGEGPRDSPWSCWAGFQGSVGVGWGRMWLTSPAPPVLWAGGMQGRHGFLSLLRRVQLLLAVHRGPVPLHPAGGDLLPREEILLLVHHHWLG